MNEWNKTCSSCGKIQNYASRKGLNAALNGGEKIVSGYFVDGYDANKNVVFEYDERRHRIPSVKSKDIERQTSIINKINPSLFLRYDEVDKCLYDAITNSNIPII